ncbi:hypothetical protein Tco_1179018 [Tanacetum coccineum]
MVNNAVKKDRDIFSDVVPELVLKEFVTHAPKIIEELFKLHMKNKVLNVHPTISISTTKTTADLKQQLYLKMKTIFRLKQLTQKCGMFSRRNLRSLLHQPVQAKFMMHIKATDGPSKGEKHAKSQKTSKVTGVETIVYADYDHAGDYDARKSTSGVCTFMGCCLTSWFSKKQTALAISAIEVEYVSARKACQQALWIKQALVDYGIKLDDIPVLFDNKGAIDLTPHPFFDSLEDLPPKATNPPPPQLSFNSIEHLTNQPPPLPELMEPL